jgi:hypothetical protein
VAFVTKAIKLICRERYFSNRTINIKSGSSRIRECELLTAVLMCLAWLVCASVTSESRFSKPFQNCERLHSLASLVEEKLVQKNPNQLESLNSILQHGGTFNKFIVGLLLFRLYYILHPFELCDSTTSCQEEQEKEEHTRCQTNRFPTRSQRCGRTALCGRRKQRI